MEQKKPIYNKSNPGTVVCVLGMHRSGTSMVMRLLNLCGVYTGKHLVGSDQGNAKGHWEHKEILSINVEILRRLGGSSVSLPKFNRAWADDPGLDDLRSKANELISDMDSTGEIWGFKEPRTCLTLPFWQKLIPDMKYVVPVRDPMEVAHSLQKRDNIPIQHGLVLWIKYWLSIQKSLKYENAVFTLYKNYFNDWKEELYQIISFINKDLSYSHAIEEIEEFIDPSLRHNLSNGKSNIILNKHFRERRGNATVISQFLFDEIRLHIDHIDPKSNIEVELLKHQVEETNKATKWAEEQRTRWQEAAQKAIEDGKQVEEQRARWQETAQKAIEGAKHVEDQLAHWQKIAEKEKASLVDLELTKTFLGTLARDQQKIIQRKQNHVLHRINPSARGYTKWLPVWRKGGRSPLVSVVLPVCQSSPYLKASIESILNQSYENIELVVVSAESLQESVQQVIASFSDTNKHIYFYYLKQSDIWRLLNKGLEVSHGEYIAIQGVGDISLPRRFEAQVRLLENNSQIGVVGSFIELVSDTGKRVSRHKVPEFDCQIKFKQLFTYSIIHSSAMLRRKTIEKNRLRYNPVYRQAAKYEFLTRFLRLSFGANLQETLVRVRASDSIESCLEMVDKLSNLQLTLLDKELVYSVAEKTSLVALYDMILRGGDFRELDYDESLLNGFQKILKLYLTHSESKCKDLDSLKEAVSQLNSENQ